MNTHRFITLLTLSGLLAACATPRSPAPITERSASAGKGREPAAAAPAASRAQGRETDKRGYYVVKRGDTLIHIALEFGQNYRDIISWNNLSNPNDIKVDQVLRVLPPDGSVTPGVQTMSVASSPGVEVRPLNSAPAAVAAPATGSVAASKTGPRGDKRIYSDAALAELQKADGSTNAAVVPAPAGAPVARVETPAKTAPADAPAVDQETVSWMWPAEGKILSTFDDTKKGIDIAGTSGQQVLAAASGKILYANSIRGYGNLVIVKHTNNLLSAYAHNKTILVKENQTVTKGQKIAEMGNTDSDAVKLHFEIRQQGKPVDPAKFLPGR